MPMTAARKMAGFQAAPAVYGQDVRARAARSRLAKADPFTLVVIALLSIVTITSSAVELFGFPRMTVLSVPFTAYILFAVRGKLHPTLTRFSLAYLLAFAPSTGVALFQGSIKWTSVGQGLLALVTMVAVGSYFNYWLSYTPPSQRSRALAKLTGVFLVICVFEIIFPSVSYFIRSYLYSSSNTDIQLLIEREARVYGIRPTAFFSEPSNFARYIGIMMTAYLASTAAAPASRWAFGSLLLFTRSVSFFVAAPALYNEARRLLTVQSLRRGRLVKGISSTRLIGLMVGLLLIIALVFVTQSTRISAALDGLSGGNGAVSGDASFNERILIPSGYLFEEGNSILLGLGPTPQDEVNDYAISRVRSIFRWQRSFEDRTAIAATIMLIAGMGWIGITIFASTMFFFRGWFGVGLVLSFFILNTFSSGYNSTISLVPSGLILGLMIYQNAIKNNLPSDRKLTENKPARYQNNF